MTQKTTNFYQKMKKSKKHFGKGKGRLSKREFREMKGYKANHEPATEPELPNSESEVEVNPFWLLAAKPWHNEAYYETNDWKYHGIEVKCNQFKCYEEKCDAPVTQMIVRSSCDMDWANLTDDDFQNLDEISKNEHVNYMDQVREELITRDADSCWTIDWLPANEWLEKAEEELDSAKPLDYIKKLMWARIYFFCDNHMMGCMNGIFCPGGSLNYHLIRRTDSDEWVHFKDEWFYQNRDSLPWDTLKTEFRLTSKNYQKVLRSRSKEILEKRNFSYVYLPHKSTRNVGFCMVCDFKEGRLADSSCPKFEESETTDTSEASVNKCTCGCPKRLHYFDESWDRFYDTGRFELGYPQQFG